MPDEYIDIDSENGQQVTLEKWTPEISPTTTFSVQDFLAKAFHLLAKGRDSRILVGRYFSRFAEYLKVKNPNWFYWKTSKVYSPTIITELSESSSNPYGNLGIWDDTKCLTLHIGFHRTESVCSLSDLLEEEVDQKYFLSDKMVALLLKTKENKEHNHGPRLVQQLQMDE